MLEYKLSEIFNKGSLVVLFLLYSNLISSCYVSISCDYFIPTLSYLSTFRSHDIVTVLALSFQAFLLCILFLAFHMSLAYSLSTDDKAFMIIQECAIILLTLTVGIVDESSGIDFNPVDDVHRFITIALCFLAASWAYWAIKFLEKNELNETQKMNLSISKTILIAGVIFVIVTMIQWHLAYTIYHGILFNNIAESIFEWISVTIAIRFPYHLCKVMDASLRLFNRAKAKE